MTLQMHIPEWKGLRRIISGGQTGADQGGLAAAYTLFVETGGMMPKGFRTNQGPMPEIAKKYGLKEHTARGFDVRTKINVENSDGTVIIARNPASAGSQQTIRFVNAQKKPYLVLKLMLDEHAYDITEEYTEMSSKLADWIKEHRIEVLNVAGNRDLTGTNFHFAAAYRIIEAALLHLRFQDRLISNPK